MKRKSSIFYRLYAEHSEALEGVEVASNLGERDGGGVVVVAITSSGDCGAPSLSSIQHSHLTHLACPEFGPSFPLSSLVIVATSWLPSLFSRDNEE